MGMLGKIVARVITTLGRIILETICLAVFLAVLMYLIIMVPYFKYVFVALVFLALLGLLYALYAPIYHKLKSIEDMEDAEKQKFAEETEQLYDELLSWNKIKERLWRRQSYK